jgi:hypothetical protein
MASIPDKAILHFCDLSPAEIKVYAFYCKSRNRQSGGWKCSDLYVATEMQMSRNRVSEARSGLEKKGWIKVEQDYFIRPIFGFDSVENSTSVVENSTKSVEISTESVENSTSIYKEVLNQPNNQENNQKKDEDGGGRVIEFQRERVGRHSGISAADILADAQTESEYLAECSEGIKARLNTPKRLPKHDEWQATFDFWYQNGYTVEELLETFDLLNEIRIRKKLLWQVSPKVVENNIGKIESLRYELETLDADGENENAIAKKDNGNYTTAAEKRTQSAIDEYEQLEVIRQRVAERNAALRGSNAAHRG